MIASDDKVERVSSRYSRGAIFGPWSMVIVFLLCITCSYVDRQVISLLVEPLKQDLGISDTQIGLLQGIAFALCYAVTGFPIARALDRGDRIAIGASCIAIWSVATAACAFVGNFFHLLTTRALTAVAEAGLPPAALSLISDCFERRQVARASALFMLGPYLGTSLALIGGGQLLSHFEVHNGLTIPYIGTLAPWRAVFLTVSLPGFLLALLVLLTLRDPRLPRSGSAEAEAEASPPSLGSVFRDHRALLIPYCLGAVFAVLVLFAQTAWLPTFFIRVHHMSAAQVGKAVGSTYLVAGLAGGLIAGMLATPRRGDPLQRVLGLMVLASVILCVSSSMVPLMTSASGSLACFAVSAAACSIIVTLVPTPLQLTVPAGVRAQFITIVAFLIAVGSAGGGPFLVGLLADSFASRQPALGMALAVTSGVSGLIGALGLCVAWRRSRA